jgi:hypothetical protein
MTEIMKENFAHMNFSREERSEGKERSGGLRTSFDVMSFDVTNISNSKDITVFWGV